MVQLPQELFIKKSETPRQSSRKLSEGGVQSLLFVVRGEPLKLIHVETHCAHLGTKRETRGSGRKREGDFFLHSLLGRCRRGCSHCSGCRGPPSLLCSTRGGAAGTPLVEWRLEVGVLGHAGHVGAQGTIGHGKQNGHNATPQAVADEYGGGGYCKFTPAVCAFYQAADRVGSRSS